jgi:transglutaminase-like putative cysteine protease
MKWADTVEGLMLKTDYQQRIEDGYQAALQRIGERKAFFMVPSSELTPDEALCLKFLIASMPVSDAASYDGQLLLKFARHALKVREETPWGKGLPDDLFLNFVLFYRINNEDIVFCRDQFYSELKERIFGKSMTQAALEINYWCYEKATYQASDPRTASPLTVIKNTRGRCGEESTLAVTAFRSAGIPARQCYVPRWSHCDDNHAWVEVWADGAWHYLGACEPEPVLNKGWFTYASSRAMLVHSRAFSPLLESDQITAPNGCLTEVNNLKTYADTEELTVTVLDSDGNPKEGASVRFEVLNYAELYPVAVYKTDANGQTVFTTGKGDLGVSAAQDGLVAWEKVDLRKCSRITLQLREPSSLPPMSEFDVFPPEGFIRKEIPLCGKPLELHEEKLERARTVRESYQSTFIGPEEAEILSQQFSDFQPKIREFLQKSKGNRQEMLRFLRLDAPLDLKIALLESLSDKDMLDLNADVLEEHLRFALPFQKDFDALIFRQYVLCPRICNEPTVPYRAFLTDYFSAEQKSSFRSNPMLIQKFIDAEIRDGSELDYDALTADPKGLLQMKLGSQSSKDLLFAAICRSLGIPSRLDPVLHKPQYWEENRWMDAAPSSSDENDRTCTLTLVNTAQEPLAYEQNLTVSKLTDGAFQMIGCNTDWVGSTLKMQLTPGYYKVITANRQIDGSILAKAYVIRLTDGENAELKVALRESQTYSRLKNLPVSNYSLEALDGSMHTLAELTSASKSTILAVLEAGAEPTEHLLNEIVEWKEAYQQKNVLLLVSSPEAIQDATLKRTLKAVPTLSVFICREDSFPLRLFEELELGDHRLPLSTVLGQNQNARFAFSNYNVGTAKLLLQISDF